MLTVALPDVDKFTDASVYFAMGLVSTIVFLIRMVMMMFIGVDSDYDVAGGDFDGDVGGHHVDSTGSFQVFSMLSITAFFMGAGWMGYACRAEWDLHSVPSAILAALFGGAMMMLASTALYQMRKLNESGGYVAKHCIGATATVYLTIPPKGQGNGQVTVTVDGRRKTMNARSTGDGIAAFTSVTVIDVDDDETLVVEPRQNDA